MSYAIITDAAANLTEKMAAENDITVIPFSYFIDGEAKSSTFPDNFDDVAFYEAIDSGAKITTSQINPACYEEYMEPFLKEGRDIVFVGMSSGISGSFASAGIAADELLERYPDRKIHLIDSLGASLGEGLIALKAAALKNNGTDIDSNADQLRKYVERIYQVFCVDNLMHLKRTGRVSGVSAVVGTALGIKPLLKGNEEGKIVMTAKIRGKKAVIKAMADKYKELIRNAEIIGISYTNNKSEELAAIIEKFHHPKQILTVKHEPATASHLGPGSLALYFEGGPKVRFE